MALTALMPLVVRRHRCATRTDADAYAAVDSLTDAAVMR